jgi:hypothetical protein
MCCAVRTTGDVADTAAAVSNAFQLLSKAFWRVVWVPGNHCLWLRPDTRDGSTYPDSLAKLMALRQVCADLATRIRYADAIVSL